jgi:hypothetical protein
MSRKLQRGIHKLADQRYWVYTTSPKGRPQRRIVSWELLKKLKVPVESTVTTLHPNLKLAKMALTRLHNLHLEEGRAGAITSSAKARVADLLPLMEADYRNQALKTFEDVQSRWKKHLRGQVGDLLATEVTVDILDKYIVKRQREHAAFGTINRDKLDCPIKAISAIASSTT